MQTCFLWFLNGFRAVASVSPSQSASYRRAGCCCWATSTPSCGWREWRRGRRGYRSHCRTATTPHTGGAHCGCADTEYCCSREWLAARAWRGAGQEAGQEKGAGWGAGLPIPRHQYSSVLGEEAALQDWLEDLARCTIGKGFAQPSQNSSLGWNHKTTRQDRHRVTSHTVLHCAEWG